MSGLQLIAVALLIQYSRLVVAMSQVAAAVPQCIRAYRAILIACAKWMVCLAVKLTLWQTYHYPNQLQPSRLAICSEKRKLRESQSDVSATSREISYSSRLLNSVLFSYALLLRVESISINVFNRPHFVTYCTVHKHNSCVTTQQLQQLYSSYLERKLFTFSN